MKELKTASNEAMTRPYSPEVLLFQDTARKFLASTIAPQIDTWEHNDSFPNDAFTTLAPDGYLGILLDEQYGGVGGDYSLAGAWCEVFGELRSVGFTTGVCMHALVIAPAIQRYGSSAVKDRWLPAMARGEKIGAYAFTEPGAGSDLASLRTKAERTSSGWRINGSKTFITNGARADVVLVLARTDLNAGYKGFTTFVVPTDRPGFKVNRTLDKLGWRASDTAELFFTDLEVSDDEVLGEVGAGWTQASNNLTWERVMLTLLTLGGARQCFGDAKRYAAERHAFGAPLDHLDAIAEMLQEMERRITLGTALTHDVLTKLVARHDVRTEAAMAKRMVCDDAVWIADRAIQLHGGYGYTTEYSPERWWRDLRLMPIGGGTSEIMGALVGRARGLL